MHHLTKKTFIFQTVTLFAILLGMLSCSGGGGGGSSSSGQLSLSITDASTSTFDAMYLTITDVYVHKDATEDSEGGWILVASPQKTYNMLDLVNGITESLGIANLEPGHYSQLRMMISATPDQGVNEQGDPHPYGNYVVDNEGNIHELRIPSGVQSGLKIVEGFTVEAGTQTELLLDFNVIRSVVVAGESGQWILNPTFQVVVPQNFGTISGIVTDGETSTPVEKAQVGVQLMSADSDEDNVVSTTITDATGAYQLMVPPGTYNLVISLDGYYSQTKQIEVVAGDILVQDFVLNIIETAGTISGTIEIINGTDEQFVTLSFRKLLNDSDPSDTSYVEVASLSVANGADYSVDLPEGSYMVLATFTVGDTVNTFETTDPILIMDNGTFDLDVTFEYNGEELTDQDQTDDSAEDNTQDHKVTICHKGHSIRISASAVPAHMRHGDTEGMCTDDSNDQNVPGDTGTGDDTGEDGTTTTSAKVTICHKGHLITVSQSAVRAHLNHGDTLGDCAVDSSDDTGSTDEEGNVEDGNTDDGDQSDEEDTQTGAKVTICHNGHPITIAEAALQAHLAHGDVLGDCETDESSTDSTSTTTDGNGNNGNHGNNGNNGGGHGNGKP